jgi:hypothetical protein
MAGSDVQAEIDQLIATTRQSDPRLHQALLLINSRLSTLWVEAHPATRTTGITPTSTQAVLPPANFVVFSTGSTLRFTWTEAVGAVQYEIRKGTTWETATFVTRTVGLRSDIDPEIYGDHFYMIKSINSAGLYSALSNVANINIPQIPAVTINSTVIDNNILLSWNTPTSAFNISHYILKRNGTEIGLVTSTFVALFEPLSGTYIYSVIAVDIAGNVGTEATLSVEVNQPPDFELHDSRFSDLSGTRVNVHLELGKLVASYTSGVSWANHFLSRGWDSIQDQLDAGYPLYFQPTELTGSYEEVIDYGVVIQSTIVTILYNLTQLAGSTAVVIKMAVSPDNITYTSFVAGASQFYASLRYLKFRLEFTGADDHALALINNINILLTVKRENDGGTVSALSTDVGGTVVTFNKPFKDVESITVSVLDPTSAFIATYDFVDVPNPISFTVYAYTTAGVRISKTISWKARGII